DRPGQVENVERAERMSVVFESDYRIVLPGGAISWIHNIGHPVLNDQGELVELVGTAVDVTEHKIAEQKIHEQEMELRPILEFTPQLVAVLGPNRERLYCNRGALDYLGMTLKEWQDKGIGLHPEDEEHLAADVLRALSNDAAFELELRVRRYDGAFRWF